MVEASNDLGAHLMADKLEDTILWRTQRAQQVVPDPRAQQVATQVIFDDVLTPLGLRAPPPEPNERDFDYLASW